MFNLHRTRISDGFKYSIIILLFIGILGIIFNQMNFSFLSRYQSFYIKGTLNTVILGLFTMIFGVLFGVIISLMKQSNQKMLKLFASSYVEFVRGTPILVQLYIVYFGLPKMGIRFFDINIPFIGVIPADFVAGIITLSINSAAYVSEIIRAGIQAVNKGQMEAARSLGLNHFTSMKSIIFPQALKNILPALGNEFIVVIKESSIVSIIGIQELMYQADTVRGNTFQPFEPLIVAAIIYFVLTFTLSKVLGIAERRMKVSD